MKAQEENINFDNKENATFIEDEYFASEEYREIINEEGDSETIRDISEEGSHSLILPLPRKIPFKLKRRDDGNILTIHHTVQDGDKLIRVRLGACCFNESGSQFLVTDKRGNLFVFNFPSKRYWRISEFAERPSAISAYAKVANQYIIGTKFGVVLLLDVESCRVLKSAQVASDGITSITFPQQSSNRVLIHAGKQAILMNLDKFTATHRTDFQDNLLAIKFACYVPQSDQIVTGFTNDSVHIWSGTSLNTIRICHPMKMLNRKLQLVGEESVQEISLEPSMTKPKDFHLECPVKDYSNGRILGNCFTADGTIMCLSTVDGYLMLINSVSFELLSLFRLKDFVIKECAFLPQPKEQLLFALTTDGKVVLIDLKNIDFKMLVCPSHAVRMTLSSDGKLLSILGDNGEVNVWSTCHIYNRLKSQERCVEMIKRAFKQDKPVVIVDTDECINAEIKKLLRSDRLLAILKEYGSYPVKYRGVIWCNLLRLPSNRQRFQELLTMGIPPAIRQQARTLKLKNQTDLRNIIKVWSCLANWCKIFAYSEFLPRLIFPFVKMFPRNALISFEICVALLSNHFQLWFEFHPLPPANYLGLCHNVLHHFDPKLSEFYAKLGVPREDYFWSLVSSAFSEVLDEEQWLCLWDNIVSCPTHFPIFCSVAYNILQREVILRLPDKDTICYFFHEQNAIDVGKLIAKALDLMSKCPPNLHPKRYIKSFSPIPKNVYPKFLNYPKEWVSRHEDKLASIQREHRTIDTRLRALELEEMKMMENLEKGLKEEEHTRLVQEMEKLYQGTIKQEEDRVSLQRKLLLEYQKEMRCRKGQVIAALKESNQHKRILQLERELNALRQHVEHERSQNETNLALAEDEVRNQKMMVMEQKYKAKMVDRPSALRHSENLQRLCEEEKQLKRSLKEVLTNSNKGCQAEKQTSIDQIEQLIDELQTEFICLSAAGNQSIKSTKGKIVRPHERRKYPERSINI